MSGQEEVIQQLKWSGGIGATVMRIEENEQGFIVWELDSGQEIWQAKGRGIQHCPKCNELIPVED